MSDLGDVLTDLAVSDIPDLMVEVMPDTMTIIENAVAQGSGGGEVLNPNLAYANVPVLYEPDTTQSRTQAGEGNVSLQQYRLTFPAYQGGIRINIDPERHLLFVNPRTDDAPGLVFRVISIRDAYEVYYEAICNKEN